MEVLQRTANRGSISTAGYEVDNSVKNEPDNGERFDTGDKFTNYSSVRKFTVSAWLKRTEITVQSLIWFNVSTATSVQLEFGSDDKLVFLLQDNVGNGVESYAKTSALFRDTSAWYHVILAVDTTQGTAANRTKIYVNGVNQTLEQGNGSYDTFPAQNYDCPLQTRHYLLGYDGGNNGFRGYAAEYYFLDGITASPTDFGEYDADSGIWKPIEYTGGFGNEGYYLNFEDASALGKDVSSNNQGNFSHYGGSAADQATDTPTNNFCTLNLLVPTYAGTAKATDGGTFVPWSGVNSYLACYGTIGVTKGKWYWEFYCPSRNGSYGLTNYIGLHSIKNNSMGDPYVGTAFLSQCNWVMHYGDYNATVNGSNSSQNTAAGLPSYGTTGVGVFFGVAFDADNGKITFYRDGTRIGNANIDIFDLHDDMGAGIFVLPFFQVYANNFNVNFGGYSSVAISSAASDANGYGTFEIAPPTGYYALCSRNLSEYG